MAEDPEAWTHLAKAQGYLTDMNCVETEPQTFEAYALAAIAESLTALAHIAHIWASTPPPERKH